MHQVILERIIRNSLFKSDFKAPLINKARQSVIKTNYIQTKEKFCLSVFIIQLESYYYMFFLILMNIILLIGDTLILGGGNYFNAIAELHYS